MYNDGEEKAGQTWDKGRAYYDYFNVDYTFGLWDGAELLVKGEFYKLNLVTPFDL